MTLDIYTCIITLHYILCLARTSNWERPCEEGWFILVSQELLLQIPLCCPQSEHAW